MLKTSSLFTPSMITVVFLMTIVGFAKTNKASKIQSHRDVAITILKKYNSSAAVEMQIKKQVTKVTLGTKTETDGILLYSKNKLYFGSEEPTKTEIIYNKNVWIIEYPDLELDDKAGRKVTVFDSSEVPFIRTIAELMSAPEKFFTKDTVITETNDQILIESDKIKATSIKKFVVTLSKSDQTISSIFLTDDLNTDTIFNILKTVFLKSTPKNKFIYKKNKTDETLKP